MEYVSTDGLGVSLETGNDRPFVELSPKQELLLQQEGGYLEIIAGQSKVTTGIRSVLNSLPPSTVPESLKQNFKAGIDHPDYPMFVFLNTLVDDELRFQKIAKFFTFLLLLPNLLIVSALRGEGLQLTILFIIGLLITDGTVLLNQYYRKRRLNLFDVSLEEKTITRGLMSLENDSAQGMSRLPELEKAYTLAALNLNEKMIAGKRASRLSAHASNILALGEVLPAESRTVFTEDLDEIKAYEEIDSEILA